MRFLTSQSHGHTQGEHKMSYLKKFGGVAAAGALALAGAALAQDAPQLLKPALRPYSCLSLSLEPSYY